MAQRQSDQARLNPDVDMEEVEGGGEAIDDYLYEQCRLGMQLAHSRLDTTSL
jgi:hypothetical protein